MEQGLVLRRLMAAMAISSALGVNAASSTLTINGAAQSTPAVTITVVDATPAAPWYQRTEILGPAVTLIVGLLAAFLAFRQIDKQRRNSLDLQREAKRNEFKLEVYREFAKKLDPTEDGLSEIALYVVSAADEADQSEYWRKRGITPTPLKHDGKVFSDLYVDAGLHVAEVIMLIERYLVVQPDLDVFRLALNAAMHDTRTLQSEILATMFKWFPIRRPEGSTVGPEVMNVREIPQDVIETLRKKGWEFHSRVIQIGSYLDDLRRELQIHLLSGIFENPDVPRRNPADPAQRVVTLDKSEVEAHRKYFLEETAWGKELAKLDREERARFAKQPVAKSG